MRTIVLMLVVGIGSRILSAQGSAPHGNRVPTILSRMENSQLSEREAALHDLCKLATDEVGRKEAPDCSTALNRLLARHPDQTEAITIGLIGMLAVENNTFLDEHRPAGTYNETDMEHYAGLLDIVSSLNDDRAILPLIGAITTGGIATQGVLKYGQKALEPLLDQYRNGSDPMARSESLATAVTLLLRQNDSASRGKISELIQASLQDKEFLLRMAAIQSIERLDDASSFVPELRELAEHDPISIKGQGPGGKDDYPVRREANRALELIAREEPNRGQDAKH